MIELSGKPDEIYCSVLNAIFDAKDRREVALFHDQTAEAKEEPRAGYPPFSLLQAFFKSVSPAGELEPAEFDEDAKPMGTLSHHDACRWLAAQLELDWDALRAEDAQFDSAEPPYGVEDFCNLDVGEILSAQPISPF